MTEAAFPSPQRIEAADRAIDPIFLATPLLETGSANEALGCRLFAKVETLNPIRSFKGRGTEWWMAHGPAGAPPVVCASAGNFGQGLARAGARRGHRVFVFAARTANPLKIEAMRRLGAEIVQEGEDFDAAKASARRFAEAQGFAYLEDGAEPLVAEGAGTIAREITETLSGAGLALDAILVPLGNGALLTGTGTWMRHAAPGCRVIGLVAGGAPSMKLSWEAGQVVSTPTADTSADGIAVREPIPYALAAMRATVDEVRAVGEDEIAAAMAFCRRHYGLVVEPAGAAGLACLLADPKPFAGRVVATILCGSNVAEGA